MINKKVKIKDKILKYLSINKVIELPNNFISQANKKNLLLLLIVLAKINIKKFNPNAPALIVKILNGIGVKPAVKIIIKSYLSYNNFILLKALISKLGTYLKNVRAIFENSPLLFHQITFPKKKPTQAPKIEPMLQIKANLNIFFLLPINNGIRRTSGGIGKNIDSINEIINNAITPYDLFAKSKTQSYKFLKNFIIFN